MEQTELDETQDIFQECDNTLVIQQEPNELKSVHINFLTKKDQQEKLKYSTNYKQTNNNHVVHIGVIIVLLTIILGMTSIQKCIVSCVENISITEQELQHKDQILNNLKYAKKLPNTQILERLLEYKNICKDLEIFTKKIEQQPQRQQEDIYTSGTNDGNTNVIVKDAEVFSSGNGEDSSEYDYSSGSSGNGDCAKRYRKKHVKSKHSIKTTGTKNGFNKYNKSTTKAKYQKHKIKDLNVNKKNSTAEPIIYLFALVFIYLLLKAASDINQHYKSQSKNDKRLRRCSLQSYAQTHRPDRRASKELASKQKQQQLKQRLKSSSRSSSQDQQNYHYNLQQKQHFLDGTPQKSSEHNQTANAISLIRPTISYSKNLQLLKQHTTTQSLDNSDISNNGRGNSEVPPSILARRCSVPAALNNQRQKCSITSPLSIATDHAYPSVGSSRRASITPSSLPLSLDSNDNLGPETKRRVRMINRH